MIVWLSRVKPLRLGFIGETNFFRKKWQSTGRLRPPDTQRPPAGPPLAASKILNNNNMTCVAAGYRCGLCGLAGLTSVGLDPGGGGVSVGILAPLPWRSLPRRAEKLVPLRRPAVTAFCRCAARLAHLSARSPSPVNIPITGCARASASGSLQVSRVIESSSSGVCARE